MSVWDPTNQLFQLAVQFVNQTGKHIFLTGKAGTGKTTFLKYIKEHSFKKMAIVAPTGVAAINAGGVTMHSFFQLPFGPFIPTRQNGWNEDNSGVTDQHSLMKNIRFNSAKRELLQELDMIIIDEVSMLRADMLDAIDMILRHFRRQQYLPFGGVQMVYIGDLFQLPPVVNNSEWNILKQYYKSPFFFDAHAIQQSQPLYFELKKIYRQNDEEFIHILNNIRNNRAETVDLEILHRYFKPGFKSSKNDNYITLTTHNSKADEINRRALAELPSKSFAFTGEIKGDFNDKAFPADMNLHLKEGAQIMFIKNDKGENRRYFNGKIGQVSRISNDGIYVKFIDSKNEIELEKETWKNIRYNFHKEKDRIEEEELGTFTQYPVRLAWAVTIHKSQGLTFEKAIIDAGASFAAGQVYVALSRLTSLNGLVLFSRIFPESISTDERVLAFTQNEKGEDVLQTMLHQEQKVFLSRLLVQSFDWKKLCSSAEQHFTDTEERQIPDKHAAIQWAKELFANTESQQEIALKFTKQLEHLMATTQEADNTHLFSRTKSACDYFSGILQISINQIQQQIKSYKIKLKVKKYVLDLQDLMFDFERKKQQLHHAVQMAEGLLKGADMTRFLEELKEQKESVQITPVITRDDFPVLKKGATQRISLEMFKEGKSIEEIARERGMVSSTIEGHLANFIETGEVNIEQLVALQKIQIILKAIEETGTNGSSAIKANLGDEYSYGEIRAVLKYRQLQQGSLN